jgi:glycosyltransferase involved in cell wall biosynthesis
MPAVASATATLPWRTVIVHDYLNQDGGAERVLESMHAIAPDAPVFVSMYDRARMRPEYRSWDVRTSFIDRVPGAYSRHQRLLPLFPVAFESMRLPDCELVLSSTSAFAKMARPPAGALHVSYVHSPMRFAWDLEQYLERERPPGWAHPLLRPAMALMRWRDRATLPRVHRFIANSTAVRTRIRAWWRRDAALIYPPVDVARYQPGPASEVEDYYLMVSRLVPYKRFDIAIEAFNRLGLPLWIAGDGRGRADLERLAGQTVRFLGRVEDDELARLYARCKAAVFIAEDDFGIAQLEAQAAGRPVIALGAGGTLDTVLDGVTGVHVARQTPESLVEAVRRFEGLRFDSERLVAHARSFSRERFERELAELVNESVETFRREGRAVWN